MGQCHGNICCTERLEAPITQKSCPPKTAVYLVDPGLLRVTTPNGKSTAFRAMPGSELKSNHICDKVEGDCTKRVWSNKTIGGVDSNSDAPSCEQRQG